MTEPVSPAEIAALLRDLPPIHTGFDNDGAREAWLIRKRDLLARIEAELEMSPDDV